jgi:hypothetical protein
LSDRINTENLDMMRNRDPLLKSARREALFAAGVWLVAMAYTVGYCCLYGYGRSAESLTFVLGFPTWVFWGIVVPWGACTLISCGFSLFFMKVCELGEDLNEAPAAENPTND